MLRQFYLTLILLLFSVCTGLSQNRLSPNLTKRKSPIEVGKTILSVKAFSSSEFETHYKGKIEILRRHYQYGSFEIVILQPAILEQLKNDSNVIFIDQHQYAKTEADFEFTNKSFNRVTKVQHLMPALEGYNSNVSIKELSFDPSNIDLLKRSFLTSASPSAISQHATNMAILLAGAGNSSYRTKGVAPKANVTSSDFNNLFPDAPSIFANNSINIQNHSYGVDIENYYGNEAAAYDQQVYQNPSLLHVFSAGNSGKLKPASGIYQNMNVANMTGNFKQAKNVLVINSVDSTLKISSNNSRGPSYDGRIKPELTAFGQGGTSDAAALVSGISTLIYEKYKGQESQTPDASMIKAILIASAEDIGAPGPDYLYGYGSVNSYDALQLVEKKQFTTITLSANNQTSIPINIPPATAQLRVAISWTDAAASVNSARALVNDIDSWIDNGSMIRPWVLSSFAALDSLVALPKRKEDHLNNVEYITIDNPKEGSVLLNLRSHDLVNTSQKVSVAFWFQAQQTFGWDFPQANEKVEGGKKNLLVWDAAKGKRGDLYLQLNQGNWQQLKSDIDLDNYFYWNSPDTFSTAKLKMVVMGETFHSGEFLISPLIKLKTAFICGDQIGLSWKKVNGADGYELFTMASLNQRKIADVVDTVFMFNPTAENYFAVAPKMNSRSGLKSELIDYKLQGTFCYINFFSAKRITASKLQIKLSLSSILNIDYITIYRKTNEQNKQWSQLTTLRAQVYEFFDEDFPSGELAYQAEITFKDKTKLRSEIAQLMIEEKGKLLLYPNPVSSNEDLNILSGGAGIKFRVLDLLGKIILEIELQKNEEVLDVLNIPSGFYVYQLFSPTGQIKDAGRFIKR